MRDMRSVKSPELFPGVYKREYPVRFPSPLPSPGAKGLFPPIAHCLLPIACLLALSGCSSRSQELDKPEAGKTEEPASASRPTEPSSKATKPPEPTADEEKLCVVGLFRVLPMQRMIRDNGYDSIIEEQSLSGERVAFLRQRAAWQALQAKSAPPAPPGESAIPGPPIRQGLLFAKGREVTDNIPSFIYGDTGGKKGKPTTYTIEPRDHTYFLVEEAWDCTGQETDVNESSFPFGKPDKKACLPEEIVKKCRAL